MKHIKFLLLILIIVLSLTSCIDPYDNITIIHSTSTPKPAQTQQVEEPITTVDVLAPISPELKVYFFYVGQGDSIFVQNGDECMLIDAGNNPDGKYISKYLRNTLGIKKIDYLVGTHAHEDHIGGIDIIIEDFEIGRFFMPDQATTLKTYTDVVSWAKKKNIEIESPKVGTTFNIGKANCEIMTQNDDADDLNSTSIVVQLSFGNQKFLFTGDIEEAVESSRNWDDIDVLKVAHHGTKYASSESFLKQVKPEIAVISCGINNDYYYPHEKVLKRLKNIGCNEIYVTKDDGTILITSDGISNNIDKIELSLDGNK